ncbi:MAG: LysM peptidoglycan-binding domain-containing protein [Lachnospiraceae bacterium]|nr:LysM peptidoglycan-binding domain-containing protein [Lachnospiraceae bacterium]
MRRVYNEKISARANESLARRARTVRIEKSIIAIVSIIIIAAIILIGSSIITFASACGQKSYSKEYTSIRIEPGDTLWDISDHYLVDGAMDKEDYIDEICRVNNISREDTLHSGEYLVVACYSEIE